MFRREFCSGFFASLFAWFAAWRVKGRTVVFGKGKPYEKRLTVIPPKNNPWGGPTFFAGNGQLHKMTVEVAFEQANPILYPNAHRPVGVAWIRPDRDRLTEWVPVSERLPEFDERDRSGIGLPCTRSVFTYSEEGGVREGRAIKDEDGQVGWRSSKPMRAYWGLPEPALNVTYWAELIGPPNHHSHLPPVESAVAFANRWYEKNCR